MDYSSLTLFVVDSCVVELGGNLMAEQDHLASTAEDWMTSAMESELIESERSGIEEINEDLQGQTEFDVSEGAQAARDLSRPASAVSEIEIEASKDRAQDATHSDARAVNVGVPTTLSEGINLHDIRRDVQQAAQLLPPATTPVSLILRLMSSCGHLADVVRHNPDASAPASWSHVDQHLLHRNLGAIMVDILQLADLAQVNISNAVSHCLAERKREAALHAQTHFPNAATKIFMSAILQSLFHPSEVANLLNFQFFGGKEQLFPPNDSREMTPSMKRCYHFLDLTSRSFTAVIQSLDPALRNAICIFYLVLRGLDTIEDDMSIDISIKSPLLVNFHKYLDQKGWTFNGNGPTEKDRQLLVEFNVVIDEFQNLRKDMQQIIADITAKMGSGMAEFAAKDPGQGVQTKEEYNLYCHYVAGLVGIGLSKLFSTSGLEDEEVGADSHRANSMGLFLQKTNIIRDYLEDIQQGRTWWPKEVWSLYAQNLGDFQQPQRRSDAIACLNHLITDALSHVDDVFVYMSRLKNQTVFNFCAIPQVMAISTLALCYNNPKVFTSVVKIRKGLAVSLMMQSRSMPALLRIFDLFLGQIQQQVSAKDPSFARTQNALKLANKHISAAKISGLFQQNDSSTLFGITLAFTAGFALGAYLRPNILKSPSFPFFTSSA